MPGRALLIRCVALTPALGDFAQAQTKLLRCPDIHGPMVALTSETSASDGDIFPYYFRFAGLGPLIGKRTWGGVVGGNTSPLVDGGTVFVPQSGTNAATGERIIEGQGVSPDIEVENDPISMLAGHDLQLERGVQEVLKRMAEHPMSLPKRPADPVKTK